MATVLKPGGTMDAEARRVFEERLRAAGIGVSGARIPRRTDASKSIPLSFAQQRLWFVDQLDPGSPVYNVPVAIRLSGPLNVEALRKTFDKIAQRHEVLRTSFTVVDGQPMQSVRPQQAVPFEVINLEDTSGSREERARQLAHEEALAPFNLENGPLFRVRLMRLDDRDHIVMVTLHHIVCDGWSTGVLVREVSALYTAYAAGQPPATLPELGIQYGDYAVWQRNRLSGERLEKLLGYWRERLADAPALDLPTDHARPAIPSYRGGSVPLRFPPETGAALKRLNQQANATPFMMLLAVFTVLLARYSGQDDVVLGSPLANRAQGQTEDLIGFFVNPLVFRANLAGNPTFQQYLSRVREACLGDFANQDIPFEHLVEEIATERDRSRHPLFQVLFDLHNLPPRTLSLGEVTCRSLEMDHQAAKFDLTLFLAESPDALSGSLEYAADLFERATIERMAGHLQNLVASILADPSKRVSELEILGDAERRQLLSDFNDTRADYPRDKCAHRLFEEQAARNPNAVAVVFGDQELTYADLNARANQLAHYLQGVGVGPDLPIGLLVARSPEMIVALLGILKAGAAYVPLDADYPPERLAHMLSDAGILVVVAQERLLDRCPVDHSHIVICIDRDWDAIAQSSAENTESGACPENLAYVIYTSGSTGTPKGVGVCHSGLANYLNWSRQAYNVASGDGTPVHSSLGFDLTITSFFPALVSGQRVILLPGDSPHAALQSMLTDGGDWTLFKITPAHLAVLREGLPDKPEKRGIRAFVIGGEALRGGDTAAWRDRRPDMRLINEYGPTETVVGCCVYDVGDAVPEGDVPIGRPIWNTELYVLDANGNPVPTGVPGELYIGGDGLARGYLGRPGLTAERFVPHPFSLGGGARLYRTGDKCRHRSDGNLEYLGRIDDQVKIRGFRIELGEIEAALLRHEGLSAAAAIVREDKPDDKQLVAYVVPAGDKPVDVSELRSALKLRLPDYMIPSAFVILDALPLTTNGKVDKKVLPAPDHGARALNFAAPATPVEELVAQIWADVLGLEQVGRNESFFELGGHSLPGTQVVSRVRSLFGVDLSLGALFEAATLTAFSERVQALQRESEGLSSPATITPQSREGALPLSFAQQRLWFIDQINPGAAVYNLPIAIKLTGPLNTEALEHAINEIVRRHEVLRTTFQANAGEPVQVIHPHAPFSVPVTDLGGHPAESRDTLARGLAQAEAARPFDLAAGPLLRASLLRLSSDEHVALLTMHHIVSDAWSVDLLIKEVCLLYEAGTAPEAGPNRDGGSPLAELAIQYADFAVWQRQWMQGGVLETQLAYWKAQLADPPVLQLPLDHPRPPVPSYRGANAGLHLPVEIARALHAVSRRAGATLFMTLLAAWQLLLSRYSGQDDIVVGSPIAGRNRRETEDLIGFFVNTLVLRTDLSLESEAPLAFTDLVGRVRATCLAAYAHQDIPLEQLVDALRPERDMSRHPLFQVMLVLQNGAANTLALRDISLSPIEVESHTAKFDLLLGFADTPDGLKGGLEYATDLFDQATVERMSRHLENLLTQIAAEPDRQIADLSLLGDAERRQLLVEFNQTRTDYPHDTCIHQLFEEQVQRTPHALAVAWGGRTLTYSELNTRANQLARHLKLRGVGPESRVGILLSRSPEMVVALFAVLKAGGAYVPLDPDYPQDRLSFMLEDSGARVIITDEKLADRIVGQPAQLREDLGHGSGTDTARPSRAVGPGPARQVASLGNDPWGGDDGLIVLIDKDWDAIGQGAEENFASDVDAENLAYVIYTSGSTGTPKGVAIAHRSAVALIAWALGRFKPDELSSVLAGTSICFDLSVFEIFVPLSCGGKVVVAAHALELASLADNHGVTLINTVPSAITELLRQDAIPASVRVVNLAGEPLTRQLADQLYARPGIAKVFDLYGPSEDTTYTTCALRTAGGPATIGSAIANTQVYILDAAMEPVPAGIPGELYTGGDGLARGYLGRAELTAERFVPNPFSDLAGQRLYRTGDLARWRADGNIEFLGRIDHQVKIRGFRIELGEIETALTQHPAVSAAVAVVHEAAPGDRRLAAYVASPGDRKTDTADLRAFLRGRLPEYMVPSYFILLDALPLTPNGKVNRKALPSPDASGRGQSQASFVGPRTGLERQIAEAWKDVLKLEHVGIEDNFFDLGGHSLLLVQLHSRLASTVSADISVMDLFQYPTIRALADHIHGEAATAPSIKRRGRRNGTETEGIAIIGMSARVPGAKNVDEFWKNLAGGVESLTLFSDEELEAAGVEPAVYNAPGYVKAGRPLANYDQFDAGFFGFTPREAEVMDPQQRVFMETCVEALETAGYFTERYEGRIGVFAGATASRYAYDVLTHPELVDAVGQFQVMLANDKDHLATRSSYKLGFIGPSVTVQTACSTSLVAVHLACESLYNDQADIVLAGGVCLGTGQGEGYLYQEDGIASPDGHCRAFDAGANGTSGGNGIGLVVLKRLSEAIADHDNIVAVIKGTAINNDGGRKVGYTAPSIGGQSDVIAEALAVSGVSADSIGYVEAHGTGTHLGDPIEIAALTQAYRAHTQGVGYCAIGSVKTNIGHLDTAAGVIGLIKAALTLKHKAIPPSLFFESANPKLNLPTSPFYVNTKLKPWTSGNVPRRAGVSSFGMGGTNAHAILEEAPAAVVHPMDLGPGASNGGVSDPGPIALDGRAASDPLPVTRHGGGEEWPVSGSISSPMAFAGSHPPNGHGMAVQGYSHGTQTNGTGGRRGEHPASGNNHGQLLVLSAKTAESLDHAAAQLADRLETDGGLALTDSAFTLAVGRKAFAHRQFLVAGTAAEAVDLLRGGMDQAAVGPFTPNIAFMFPGQGSQHVDAARGLYGSQPVFREHVDRCCDLLKPLLGWDLRAALFSDWDSGGASAHDINDTSIAQPALFVLEYALAQLWMSWGVRPQAMIGHSIGEYVAACLAGVWALPDALALVAARGRLMQRCEPGAMVSIPLPESDVRGLLGPELSLAAVNAPSSCVVSGPNDAVEALLRSLAERNIDYRKLHVSHAFHSRMMEPILGEFTAILRGIRMNAPEIPFVSNVTGALISDAEATDPAYWTAHLRQTVRFGPGLAALASQEGMVLLEVGPGQALSALAKRQLVGAREQALTDAPSAPEAGLAVLSSLPRANEATGDHASILNAVGRLWTLGVQIDWPAFYNHTEARRVPLPTYPFERQSYRVRPSGKGSHSANARSTAKAGIDDWFHVPVWQPSVLSAVPRPGEATGANPSGLGTGPGAMAVALDSHAATDQPSGIRDSDWVERSTSDPTDTWLVFANDSPLTHALQNRLRDTGHAVVAVQAGSGFHETGANQFVIDPMRADDYRTLFAHLEKAGQRPNKVLHLWSVVDVAQEASGAEIGGVGLGFTSLLFLAQALDLLPESHEVEINVCSNNLLSVAGEGVLRPERATILGPCKVIPQEYPSIRCRHIDVAVPSLSDWQFDRLVCQIEEELNSSCVDSMVAYRGPQRWTPVCQPIRLPQTATGKPVLRPEGVYLLTGGLGGIALALAAHLAKTLKAKIVLVGRSAFPDKLDWNNWLGNHGGEDGTSKKIRQLQEMEVAGAEVLVLQADVASREQMERAVSRARERFGVIHGVVHAAGIAGGGVIPLKTLEATQSVIAPKVAGALVLDAVFRDQPLDFIVYFSSLNAITGGVGQVDYCGANAVLDALAHRSLYPNDRVSLSINWAAWGETGMAANADVPAALREAHAEGLRDAFTSREGVQAFERALASRMPQVIVSKHPLNRPVENPVGSGSGVKRSAPPQTHPRPASMSVFAAPKTEMEQAITEIWQDILGIDRIGVRDNFFDLGGDSLIATQVVSRLRQSLQISLPLRLLLESPTVEGLAASIEAAAWTTPDVDAGDSDGGEMGEI